MATKKRSSAASSTQPLARLQTSMRGLQRDAERLLQDTRKRATAIISRDQRKALDRLIDQAQKLRGDLEKRAQRATRDIEGRTEKFLSSLEKEAKQRLSGLLQRLDLATRDDVQGLSRRLNALEKKLPATGRVKQKKAGARPSSSSESHSA